MGLRVYGHHGRPIVAFPPQGGRHQDFEGFGMIDAVAHLIEGGCIRVVSVDSVDGQRGDVIEIDTGRPERLPR